MKLLVLAVVVSAASGKEQGRYLRTTSPTTTQTSSLWGRNGENWDPVNGMLRDFTDVGYELGDRPIPDYPIYKNVTDPLYGAVADDDGSDVEAFRMAIADCPPYHAVGVPNGRYIIDEALDITVDNIVIRGESRDGAVLFFPKHMSEIEGTMTSTIPFITFLGGQQRGIERLSLVLRDETKGTGYWRDTSLTKQRDPHWYYTGERMLTFGDGENNSWARDIYIKNSNHAIQVQGRLTKQISIVNVVLDQFVNRKNVDGGKSLVKRHNLVSSSCDTSHLNVLSFVVVVVVVVVAAFSKDDGHMGIHVNEGPQYILVHNIWITGTWSHDICTMGTQHSVFSRIKGENLELDHHARGNSFNLFTEVDTGIGGRGYGGANNNQYETYWGIKGIREASYLPETSSSTFVGIHTNEPTSIADGWHHETLDPNALVPGNIWMAQMATKPNKYVPADVLLTLPPPSLSSVRRLLPVDDAYVYRLANTTNYGYNDGLYLTRTREGYVKFDMNGLDMGAVASATLKVYIDTIARGESFGLQLYQVDDHTWSESTLTYGTIPAVGTQLLPPNGLDAQYITNADLPGFVELDLTAHVNDILLSGGTDKVMSLQIAAGGVDHGNNGAINIPSKEGENALHLVIHEFVDTIPPPSPPAGLTATSGTRQITLDWIDNLEYDLASYNVYRFDGAEYKREAMGLTTSQYTDYTVWNSTAYTYFVTAVDFAGSESILSTGVSTSLLTTVTITNSSTTPATTMTGSATEATTTTTSTATTMAGPTTTPTLVTTTTTTIPAPATTSTTTTTITTVTTTTTTTTTTPATSTTIMPATAGTNSTTTPVTSTTTTSTTFTIPPPPSCTMWTTGGPCKRAGCDWSAGICQNL
eukprot:scaffold875_cov185-Amphora_coffeaeformis.AAC.8